MTSDRWMVIISAERNMSIGLKAGEEETPPNLVPFLYSFTWALLCQGCLLLLEFQHKSHLRSPWVCTKQCNLVGENMEWLLCYITEMSQRWLLYAAPRLISWKQSDTCWCKSPSVPNSDFSIPNRFKHEPSPWSRFLAIYSLSTLHTLINCSQHLLTNQTGWALGLQRLKLLQLFKIWVPELSLWCWATSPRGSLVLLPSGW